MRCVVHACVACCVRQPVDGHLSCQSVRVLLGIVFLSVVLGTLVNRQHGAIAPFRPRWPPQTVQGCAARIFTGVRGFCCCFYIENSSVVHQYIRDAPARSPTDCKASRNTKSKNAMVTRTVYLPS